MNSTEKAPDKSPDKSSEKPAPKTIVITGGATGIGLETAATLMRTGLYRLILVGLEKAELEKAANALREMDPARSREESVFTYACDFRKAAEVQAAMERITSAHRTLYGLVNNAGVYPFGDLSQTTLEQWRETFQINMEAPFLFTQGLLQSLKRQEGGARIVNLSSTAGILPNHFALAYSVSKAALIHFTRTIAKELGRERITVNCVCPGIVRSALHEHYHASRTELEGFYAKKGAQLPLGRVGETKDVASAVKFLLSEDAAWITGENLVVDGGRLIV